MNLTPDYSKIRLAANFDLESAVQNTLRRFFDAKGNMKGGHFHDSIRYELQESGLTENQANRVLKLALERAESLK